MITVRFRWVSAIGLDEDLKFFSSIPNSIESYGVPSLGSSLNLSEVEKEDEFDKIMESQMDDMDKAMEDAFNKF